MDFSYIVLIIFMIMFVLIRVRSQRGDEIKKKLSDNASKALEAASISKVEETFGTAKSSTKATSKSNPQYSVARSGVTTKTVSGKGTNYAQLPKPPKYKNSVRVDTGRSRTLAIKDDCNGDWLAKQLKDEKVSYSRMSEMFQLKAEHSKNCDAQLLKEFHHFTCEADKIDMAAYR